MLLETVGPVPPVQKAPSSVFGGNAAMNVQDFTALNCKRGSQFEASTYVAALAAGGFVDFVVEVGALPVLIKGRRIEFNESGVRLEVYKNPVYTGGAAVPYYNLNKWKPNTGLSVLRSGMTVSAVGTKCSPDREYIGGTTTGQTYLVTHGDEAPGLETVLEPGARYLFRTVNTHTSACRYSSYSTWYEGLLDIQTG